MTGLTPTDLFENSYKVDRNKVTRSPRVNDGLVYIYNGQLARMVNNFFDSSSFVFISS